MYIQYKYSIFCITCNNNGSASEGKFSCHLRISKFQQIETNSAFYNTSNKLTFLKDMLNMLGLQFDMTNIEKTHEF